MFSIRVHMVKRNRGLRQIGFTLVELLVVLGVISILMSLLLPAVQSVREAARSMNCRNHLRQWTIAALAYESAFEYLPGPWFNAPPDQPSYKKDRGLFVQMLPYIEQSNADDQFKNTSTFDPSNGPNLINETRLFSCPSAAGPSMLTNIAERFSSSSTAGLNSTTSDYVGNGGYVVPNGSPPPTNLNLLDGPIGVQIAGLTTPTRLSQITDGLSSTFLFWDSLGSVIAFPVGGSDLELETNGNALGSFTLVADASKGLVYSSVGQASSKSYVHSWAGVRIGNIVSIGGQTMNASNTLGEPYSRHRAGCNFAFADGSVRALHESTDQQFMFALASSAGHEVVRD